MKLKVSSKSNPNSVAGAIAGMIREENELEIVTVGAGALNQAIKAIAIARGFTISSGIDLKCVPSFTEVESEVEKTTGILLKVIKEEE